MVHFSKMRERLVTEHELTFMHFKIILESSSKLRVGYIQWIRMSLDRFSLCTSNSRKLKPSVRKSIKFGGNGRCLRAFLRRCNPVLLIMTLLQSFRRLGVSDFGLQVFLFFDWTSDSVVELIDEMVMKLFDRMHRTYQGINYHPGMGRFYPSGWHDRITRFEHNNKSFAVDFSLTEQKSVTKI